MYEYGGLNESVRCGWSKAQFGETSGSKGREALKKEIPVKIVRSEGNIVKTMRWVLGDFSRDSLSLIRQNH